MNENCSYRTASEYQAKSPLPLPANAGLLSGVLQVEGRLGEAEGTVDEQGLVWGVGSESLLDTR